MRSWAAMAALALLLQQASPETRIIQYLRANTKPGQPVNVTELHNNVFKTPQERAVLNRLFNTFFKIPLAIIQFNTTHKRIPTLQELSDQFDFKVPGEMDVMLRVMESDPRVPKFIERDSRTGQITRIDAAAIKADPQFGRSLERTIAGGEGKPAPAFSIQSFSGQVVTSTSLAGKPYLIYFWFSNCPPCVKTAPLLVELDRKYAAQGFRMVAANADRVLELPYTDADRAAYIRKTGITFQAAHLSSQMQRDYGEVTLFPTLLFVDRRGTIVKRLVSYQDKPALEAAIQQALKP